MSRKVITSGFVYIWFDRKHRRFYIGSHWGLPTDKYICSSAWMINSYRRRPEDFKRRIIETVHTTRQDLYRREFEWLKLIKREEIGKKYYNLNIFEYPGSIESNEKRSNSVKKTMSTPVKKLELSEQSKNRWALPGQKDAHSKMMKDLWATEEHRSKVIPKIIAANNTPAAKAKTSEDTKKRWEDPEYRRNQAEKHTGLKMPTRTEEHSQKLGSAMAALWADPAYRDKMATAQSSEKSKESSKRNIRACHSPEAIAKCKAVIAANREAKKNDPEYIAQKKEQARNRALRRWNLELFAITQINTPTAQHALEF
jgi:hypothetical protein